MSWHTTRVPTASDADPFGMVRWGPTHPGLLCRWDEVREGEAWSHSSAWQPNCNELLTRITDDN